MHYNSNIDSSTPPQEVFECLCFVAHASFFLCTRLWTAHRRAAQHLWQAHSGKYLCLGTLWVSHYWDTHSYPYSHIVYLTLYSYHLIFKNWNRFKNSTAKNRRASELICSPLSLKGEHINILTTTPTNQPRLLFTHSPPINMSSRE